MLQNLSSGKTWTPPKGVSLRGGVRNSRGNTEVGGPADLRISEVVPSARRVGPVPKLSVLSF